MISTLSKSSDIHSPRCFSVIHDSQKEGNSENILISEKSSNQRLKDIILKKKDPPCVAAEEGVKGFLLFAQSWSLQINLSLSLIRILTEHGPFFAHFWFKWVKWKITEKSEPVDTAKGYKEVKYKLVLSNSSWTASSQVCCAQKHAKFCNRENI